MEISTAHIFYIVMILAVGGLAGYFIGRRSAEADARRERKRKLRRKKIREKARKKAENADSDAHTPESDEDAA